MEWLLLGIASVCAVELSERLPLVSSFVRAAAIAKKAALVLASNSVSDHWKERVLLVYSRRLLKVSLFAIILAACAASPLFFIGLAAQSASLHYWQTLTSLLGSSVVVTVSVLYALARPLVFNRL